MWHNMKTKGLLKKVMHNIERLKLSLFLLTLFSLGITTACGGGGETEAGDSGTSLSVPVHGGSPLRVDSANPRYFKDALGHAIYLTGFHSMSILDSGPTYPPPALDYASYLDQLKDWNLNFLRLWRFTELTQFNYGTLLYYDQPHPWARTGPGTALDGKPKFDLNQFDQSYFDRLRSIVVAARDRGIYVSVMLFEGHAMRFSKTPWNWSGHPMNINNNINSVNGDTNGDGYGLETQTLPLPPGVDAIQKAYVRKVIDTVNDLDNVLFEVCNESGTYSKDWQYSMANYIKSYEATKPKQHPVGITEFSDTLSDLTTSPADWISPFGSTYRNNPPVADGSKVSIVDTDHIGAGDAFGNTWDLWNAFIWKNFTRGHNVIMYEESLTGRDGALVGMSDTLYYSRKMNLETMIPSTTLCSTTYCLANLGVEYLIYQPSAGAFTLTLPSGTYYPQWFDPHHIAATVNGSSVSGGRTVTFTPPFNGSAVLYLTTMKTQ
jgi:hypothetical protein